MDRPITAVWEITMGCNMRCKHCGSSCAKPLPGELTTEEALALCEDIAALGMKWITLSGGEPLIRKDWALLVRRLRELGVIPNIISNGWMCSEEVIDTAKQAGVGTFAISLDGTRDIHDYIRRAGSYDRALKALKIMAEMGVAAGVITTVQRRNIDHLAELYQTLRGVGLTNWQLQIGLPMGNLRDQDNIEMVLGPEAVDQVIDFIHERSQDPQMSIYPADCLGYYSRKEIEARTRAYRSDQAITWQGCNAGKRSLGILHNGDILGCTSIRDRAFIEGNIRERPLAEIWNDPNSFAWSRGLTKKDLGGHCRSCGFGDVCLGGCPNTRLTANGTIYSSNAFCAYSVGRTKAENALATVEDEASLRAMATKFVSTGEYQLAAMVLERLLSHTPDDVEILSSYGFVSYALHNLEIARDANERALRIKPDHIYATKGLGVVLHAMGQSEAGIEKLRQAVEMTDRTDQADMDSYHDLAVVYLQSGHKDEARHLLNRARILSPAFAEANAGLYQAVG
jgi:radical SAM protein with 4Fe4S-binding SPASM domain